MKHMELDMKDPTISLAPGGFYLRMYGEHLSNQVFIPESVAGLRVLKRILAKREGKVRPRVGEEGHPVSSMVEQWLKAERAAQKPQDLLDLDIDLDL